MQRIGMLNITMRGGCEFIIHGQKKPAYPDIHIFGKSPRNGSFYYTTFIGTKLEQRALGILAGVPYNASQGYLVVGLDTTIDGAKGLEPSNLKSAVGVNATCNLKGKGSPFILDPLPKAGTTILQNGSSFVTWPNRDTLVVGNISVGHGSAFQECRVSPALEPRTETAKISVFPDSVSVISFICT